MSRLRYVAQPNGCKLWQAWKGEALREMIARERHIIETATWDDPWFLFHHWQQSEDNPNILIRRPYPFDEVLP